MSSEGNADPLASLRNEVLRRIGRNLLLFQQIEMLMKFLLANTLVETGPTGPPVEQLARQKTIRKKSLGQLRGQFFDEMFAPPAERPDSNQIKEIRIRSSFHISVAEADQLHKYQAYFEAMTDERNDLVHHFLERYRLTETASLETALPHLDQQRERALPLHTNLKQLHDALIKSRREMATFFQSQEGDATIKLMQLQSSKIVTLLAQAAQKLARADGWTLLSSAANFIAAEDPEQLPSIKRRFGHQGLKSLASAVEIFAVGEEATAKGGMRTVYRLKPGATEFV